MKKHILVIFSILAITACNDSGNSNKEPNNSVPKETAVEPPVATENYSQILLSDKDSTVSLAHNISDPQGYPVTLTSVVPLSEQCAQPENIDHDALSFKTAQHSPSVCFYQYTVQNKPKDGQQPRTKSSYSYVLASETKTSSVSSPISATLTVNSERVVDLKKELGAEFPEDYLLVPPVLVVGSGAATVTNDGKITYVSSDDKGISRVVYSLESSDSSDVKVGYIDMAVSGEGNTMPEADNIEGPEDVVTNSKITIDVKDSIRDADDDTLQLTDVYVFNATAHVTNPDDVNNTSFDFEASEPGRYDVSYYIYGHRNGYAIGMVRITVGLDMAWDDITLGDGEFYTAPWDTRWADSYGLPYQSSETETINGNDYSIAEFNYDTSKTLCSLRGMMLPSLAQLQKLYAAHGNVGETDNWPTVTQYWTSDSDEYGHTAYSLSNGESTTATETEVKLVTCVYAGELKTETSESTTAYTTEDLSPEPGYYHTIDASLTGISGDPIPGEQIYLSSSSPNLSITPTNAQTNSEGSASFQISSQSAGSFDVAVKYLTQTVTSTFRYIYNAITEFDLKPDSLEGSYSMVPAETKSLVATAYYDSESSDVTNDVSFNVTTLDSSGGDVVEVDAHGKLTALATGTASVKASYDEYDSGGNFVKTWPDDVGVKVTREFDHVELSPTSTEIPIGKTQTFALMYCFTDSTCTDEAGLSTEEKARYKGVITGGWKLKANGTCTVPSSATISDSDRYHVTVKGVDEGCSELQASLTTSTVDARATVSVIPLITRLYFTPASGASPADAKTKVYCNVVAEFYDGTTDTVTKVQGGASV